jgi:tetratricopeptide (TPR) repeat protein
MFRWLSTREASEAGVTLADKFPVSVLGATAVRGKEARGGKGDALQAFLGQAMQKIHAMNMNFYKRAWFANSFKWRLLENGVDAETANEWTQTLVLGISSNGTRSVSSEEPSSVAEVNRPAVGKARSLSALADDSWARGAYADAVAHLQDLVVLRPHDSAVLNRLGAALTKVGRYRDAESYFRKAIARRPDDSEAHGNVGAVCLARGRYLQAESSLRRALRSKPADLVYRRNLGLTLVNLGRLPEARAQFERVLKAAPRNLEALVGMGLIARTEGRFDEAGALFHRALEVNPTLPAAWAALAGIRRMTSADDAWLERAEQIAAGGITPMDEATLRFAMGKYCDDVQDFERAFKNYKRANELLMPLADKYQPEVATRFADDLIRVYTREALSAVESGASTAVKPVFVIGMMRSGTSLVEQIIASHPQATGAGELTFWFDAVRKHEALMRRELVGESLRKELAEGYLQALARHSADALRIVDKTPVNSDYLGVIHSVFPNARIIYVRRNPIDTCLSCYFQPLSPALSFTMDLADLAHHYREHQRLISHWRAVLPPGSILEVPYAELVANQERWTRKILDFLGLEWDQRCLDFHRTTRPVATASYWQVRQRIYNDSVERWRHYRKFIGPLLDLKE